MMSFCISIMGPLCFLSFLIVSDARAKHHEGLGGTLELVCEMGGVGEGLDDGVEGNGVVGEGAGEVGLLGAGLLDDAQGQSVVRELQLVGHLAEGM